MALPEVTLTITDGALGIVPEAIDGISAKVGCCSLGTPATLYSFSDIKTLVATLGVGPLVEASAHLLAVAGGPVYCVPATIATQGAASAIVKGREASPTVTVAGNAKDAYEARVLFTGAGDRGVAIFKYSLDGGDNYSPLIVVPSGGDYLMPDTGLTLTFPAGSYAVADLYTFTSTAPAFDTTGLAAAMAALAADPREWRFVHVVGQATNAAGSASVAAALDTALTTAQSSYRYVRGLVDGADDTDANFITAFASTAPLRTGVAVGMVELASSVTGRLHKRPAGWVAAARMAKAPVHEDLGRVASGSLPGVSKLYRDERVTPGLDAQRFTTVRSFVGLPGSFITSGRTLAPVTSDFQLFQHGFVVDKGCRITRTALLRYLNDDVRVNATSGFILEEDAQSIESDIKGQLEAALIAPGNASAVVVKVSRTENMLSTQTLPVTVRIIPKGYARFIAADIGLLNPALQPV
jgi:hypothetical protein